MPIADSEHQAARIELERVLASPGFARNDRMARFLRFVVEKHLDGTDDEIKESVLAVEIFGRSPDHDPRQDSIVRTEASRLRTRLSEYYLGDGKDDPIVIELPKGGYVPVMRRVAAVEPSSPLQKRERHGRRVWIVAALSFVLLAVAVMAAWLVQRRNKTISIAVLPLINLSQEPNSDYFTDGLTGEIIGDMSLIDGLVVRSQTSSFAFKGKPQNVHEAGRQLSVDYILEGSVLRTGVQLRINVQLIRVHDDFPLWSGRYNREVTDVFVIQDEISRGIVNSLRLKLGRGRRRYETSTEAYDLYLRGRAFEISSATSGRNRSVGFYEQAVAKDTSFAPAYAALAADYAYRTGEDRVNWGGPDRLEETTRMRSVVAKALQLDPLLAEAHAALGMVQARDSQWLQAEKTFRYALDLEPHRALTHVDFATSVLLPLGRIEEAVTQARLAKTNDPLSPGVRAVLAYALFSAGRIDEAAANCDKPCTRALMLEGRAGEAIPILEVRFKDNLTKSGSGALGYSYALAGRRQDAEKIAALQPRPIEQAEIFVALGDKDRAFDALDRAIPLGPVRIGRALTFPEFASLRGDPRVKMLRKKVGLPE